MGFVVPPPSNTVVVVNRYSTLSAQIKVLSNYHYWLCFSILDNCEVVLRTPNESSRPLKTIYPINMVNTLKTGDVLCYLNRRFPDKMAAQDTDLIDL